MHLEEPLKRLWRRIVASPRSIVVLYLVGLVVVVAMVLTLGSITSGDINDVPESPSEPATTE